VAALVLACGACTTPDKPKEEVRPNIVFVLLDDMNARLLPYLPGLAKLLPESGLTLEMTIPTPVCSPSRATILTGRYAHNTGVKRNGPRGGGVWAFRRNGSEASTFAVWLRDAVFEDGAPVGVVEDVYDSDYFAAAAAEWVASAPEPFLAAWWPMAPHGPFVSPPRHRGRFDDVALEFAPSFAVDRADVEALTRTRLEMMLGVEEGVAALLAALEKRGALDRTYVFFTSDHGLFMGEHGFPAGKGEAYEETTRVPLFVRGPGVPVGRSDALIAGTDLAPTFAAIAGAPVPPGVDGRSFLPVLHGAALARPRKRVLLEWFDQDGSSPWLALRGRDEKIVRAADGSCKRFALDADPYEMQPQECDPETAARAAAQIERLATCAGRACVAAESE
jgi:arylsulfatase A-like enzyme